MKVIEQKLAILEAREWTTIQAVLNDAAKKLNKHLRWEVERVIDGAAINTLDSEKELARDIAAGHRSGELVTALTQCFMGSMGSLICDSTYSPAAHRWFNARGIYA